MTTIPAPVRYVGSAYAEFAERRKGSITEGRDIFRVPPRDLLGTRPVLTMVGGRVVYEAEPSRSPAEIDAPEAANRQH